MRQTNSAKFIWSCLAIVAVLALIGAAAWWFRTPQSPIPQSAAAGNPSHEAQRSTGPGFAADSASERNVPLPNAPRDFNAESSDEELLRMARIIVERSPQWALAWAQGQSDPALRDRLVFAVLRAWGERDPRAAVYWSLGQDESRRFVNVEAALAGAAAQPDLALQLGRELLSADPDSGSAYATALIGALSGSGKFQAALEFANEGPADARAGWLSNLFQRWGENHPDQAVKALDSLADRDLRDAAFQALVTGWALGNPSGLADYASALPAGEDRARAFNAALENWCLQDPASVGEWLNALPSSFELDRAIALLVTRSDSVNRSSEVAMNWVECIADPKLRRDTLKIILQEWTQADGTAAWKYLSAIPWLSDGERDEIRQSVKAGNAIAGLNEAQD